MVHRNDFIVFTFIFVRLNFQCGRAAQKNVRDTGRYAKVVRIKANGRVISAAERWQYFLLLIDFFCTARTQPVLLEERTTTTKWAKWVRFRNKNITSWIINISTVASTLTRPINTQLHS